MRSSMSLDLGDKAIVREIAYEVAVPLTEKMLAVFKDGMKTEVKVHMLECPLRSELTKTREELDAEKNRRKGAWAMATVIATILASLATIAVEFLRK